MKTKTRIFLLSVMTSWLSTLAVAHAQTTIVWSDNFERPDPTDQWSVENGVWEFGNPATGPATNSAGYRTHDGTNCAATVLAGNYPAGTPSRLIRTTPFVVPSASQNPRLQFWHWYQFSGNSYGVVQIKYGTNNWADLSPRYYATGSGVWSRPVVDLKAYAGKAVQIAFQIVADGNVADGWDVDQVSVIKGPYTVGFTNGLTESFESGLGDWSAETGTWEVGVPTSGPNAAHGGANCLATVLGGNYADDRSSRFISPAFVVPTADQNPRLRFWSWYSIGGHDFCEMQIKVGTNAWQSLHHYTSTGSGVWSREGYDLSAYAGQSVQLGFYFESHGYYYNNGWDYGLDPGPGWYVDEVAVVTGPIQTLQPNISEGFESGWKDWYAEDGTWEIGQPTSGPGSAHGGTNCAATVLGGNYADDTSGRLISPSFVVPAADQNPRLRFWSWYSIGGHDFCEMQIKVGTNAWQSLHHYTSTGSGVWSREGYDLSAYAGQSVQLGFYFESHGYYYNNGWDYGLDPGPGWYVDEVAVVTGPIQTLQPNISEGFESGWKDWYAEDGTWEIGQPTSGPGSAHGGTNCAATVLGGNYADDTSGRLISPSFVVPAVGTHPNLRFWHWFSIAGHDFCEMQIKVAGGSWQTLSHYGTANSGAWTRPSFDLSAYAGQSVQLGFYFESHGYYYNNGWNYGLDPGPGWYVDEVMITSVTPPTGIVQFTDARYFINEGETNATITVERKYGGAGAVDVTYVATDGSAVSPDDFDADVNTLSWADGEQGVKSFTVQIHQDALVEGNETVTLQLAVPGALASSVARENATLVIIDDDGVLPLSTNIAYLRSLVVTTNYVATNTTSLFTVDGTVTTYANLSTTAADELFFMQDNTNGIAVLFRGGTNQFMPQAGDRLRVTATLTNINGLLALAPNFANITNVVWPLSHSNSLPTPAALDFAARANVLAMEATEARYVSAAQVMIDQTGGSTFPTVLTDLVVTNLSGQTFSLTIHPNTDLAGKPKPAGLVTILGVMNQNDSTTPYTTNYALLPTRYADIITAPTITGQPQSRTNGAGTTATFTVSAVGTEPLGYQWRRDGLNLFNVGNISGANSNVLTLANVQPGDAKSYSVVVTNFLGSVTSSVATLTVVTPVTITTQPQSQTNDVGTDVTFTVGASGTAPFTYQWYWNTNTLLPNATNAVLILSAVQTNQAGTYHVVVNNAANLPTNSAFAVLAVNVVPVGDFIPHGGGLGWFTNVNNVYTVTGGGEDIEGTEDRFFYVHLPWTGDGEIMANLRSLTNAPSEPLLSEAGLMFRDGMTGGARHVFLAMNAGKQKIFRRRLAVDDYSLENASRGTNNVWLKLQRIGDTFIGHYSTNGVNWEMVWWTTQPNLPATLEVGLAVTAHHNGEYATGVFDLVGPRSPTPTVVWSQAQPGIQLGGEPTEYPTLQWLGGFKLLVASPVGDQFSVKGTTNLAIPYASWTPLGFITNQYGVVPFLDPQALTNQHRYYRLQKVGP